MKKILYVTNDSWFFVSHRLPIAEAVVQKGYKAVVVAKADDTTEAIQSVGATFRAWDVSPRGTSLLGELRSVVSLWKIIKSEKPDLVHLVTLKPVLYGGMISRLLKVPACVYAVSGLGSIFSAESIKSKVLKGFIKPFYTFAISHKNSLLIFQNPTDREQLSQQFGLAESLSTIIPGSGVDLSKFELVPEPQGKVVVTMASRLLKDKGVREFVEAAQLLRADGCRAKFQIAGSNAGSGNPSCFSQAELDQLAITESVNMLGHCDDIPKLFANSSLVVLPSYREGLPKVLLEAAAAGRAIVTTDVPGCRDAVEANKTALLVKEKDPIGLSKAMLRLIDDHKLRHEMGVAGRTLVEREMNIKKIIAMHIDVYNRLNSSKALGT